MKAAHRSAAFQAIREKRADWGEVRAIERLSLRNTVDRMWVWLGKCDNQLTFASIIVIGSKINIAPASVWSGRASS